MSLTVPSGPPGAAAAALVTEIRKKVRESGLVVWLDADGHYTSLVDSLGSAAFPYPVVALRGSYLELMLALESYGSGPIPEHVLIHVPGLNKETVKETPVYELYKAGSVFEKNVTTLVREAAVGIARPDEIDAFVAAQTPGGLRLAAADAWLASLRAEPRDTLTLLLESLGLDDVALGLLADDPRLRGHLPKEGEALLAFLERGLGVSPAFRAFRIGDAALTASALSTLLASWLMSVEFVHDLKEAPLTPELAPLSKLGAFAPVCRKLAVRFRELHPEAYEQFANELQEMLTHDRTSHHASALGAIDTFRFEEATTRMAALGALRESQWEVAEALAAARTPDQCFWVKRSESLQRTWEIITLAARTGRVLAATAKGLEKCNSLDEAVERYAAKLAPVDRAHRVFEQRAHAVIKFDLDDYDALLEVRGSVRRAYRAWADANARAFFELCGRHGPLPTRGFRQRAIYEDVVHPRLGEGERVAFLLVDALRFEMAQGLAEDLKRDKFEVTLGARLAELPTETRIGMNALAPVEENGRLRLVTRDGSIIGFGTKEFTVSDPPGRVRAMSLRSLASGAAEDLALEEFQEMSVAQLKRRLGARSKLVVVRSRELDAAGEHGFHLGTFEQTLTLLKSAVLLLSQAGIERIVIASDHGFLLQDATTENITFGVNMCVAERRHAQLTERSGMPDVLEVRLSELEYDVTEDAYLVFRPDTALWKTKEKVATFVHGGNSLQERVIPVLELRRPVTRGKTTSKYEVVARAEPAHLGRQRLRLAVRLQNRENASLGFLSPKSVSLALRVPGRSDVAISLLNVGPPATLAEGRIVVPPNRDEAFVEFELEGETDEKVRVEVFHPDAAEDVAPKVVEGFFDLVRNRRLGKSVPAPALPESTPTPPPIPPTRTPTPAPTPEWADLVADEGHRRVLAIIAERRSINEVELEQVLGTPRRVRAFARQFDALLPLLPFGVEILTVAGMKAYARKD